MKSNKAWKRALIIIVSAILLITPVIYTMYRMGVFIREPEIEYAPDMDNTRVLRIIGDKDFAPYSFIGEDGSPTGLDVEAMILLCDRMGYRAEIELVDHDLYLSALNEGRADIAMGRRVTGITIAGEATSMPFIDDDLLVWSKAKARSLSDLSGKRVGLISGGLFAAQYPSLSDCDLVELGSPQELFAALQGGMIDYAICQRNVGRIVCFDERYSFSEPMFFSKSYLGYGLVPGSEIYASINIELEEMYRDGTRSELTDRWIDNFAGHYTIIEAVSNHLEVYLVFALLWVIWILVVIIINRNEKVYMRELSRENAHKLELQEALEMAKKANEAKSIFLFNMSHDIRTPLNAILGSARLARDKKDSEGKLDGYIDSIILSGNYLLGVLNDVLEMSRIENNRLVIEEEIVDTDALHSECKTLVHELIGDKDITFTEDIGASERYLYIDKVHALEIFINLVSNAVKYTNEGGSLKITVRQRQADSDDEVIIETIYEDTGIGMSEEFLEHAFESFEREKTSASSSLTGTGLGLAIVKRLAQLMNGTISIVSTKGEGTKVTVALPHRIGEAPSDEAKHFEEEAISCEGLSILLAEDNDINAGIAMEFFADEGFVVDRARDGRECIKMLTESEGAYDVVLMDIQMPVMNGYEAAKQIRELDDEELKNIPIIALTANAFKEDIDRAMEAGMNAHISKPIDVSNMLLVLGEVLHR